MIKFENVSVEVADGRSKREIVSNLNIVFPNKGLIGLIGNSGSGKSTIFNLISHEISKTKGKIFVCGYDFDNINEKDENQLRNSVVSYISQDVELYNNLTSSENIDIILSVCGISKESIGSRYNKYIKLLGLEDLIDEKVSNLSGGERQRLAIFVNVLRDARIILSDEPTSALDDNNSHIVLNALKEIAKDRLVIVSSHNVSLLKEYTNEYIVVEYGKIIENNINCFKEAECELIEYKKPYNLYMVGKKLLYHQRFRRIFSTIMLVFSMILTIIGLYNVSFDKYDYMYNAYDNNMDYFVVSNTYSISDNTLELSDVKGINNTFDYYYGCNIITYDDIFGNGSEKAFAKNVIIDNTLSDYDVMITDFMHDEMTNKDIFNLIFDGNEFHITKIIKTNYKKYESFNDDKQALYEDFADLSFYNMFMNKNTFEIIRNQHLRKFEYKNNLCKANKINTLDETTLITGDNALDQYDIVVTPRFIYLAFGIVDSNLDIYLNKTVNLNVSNTEYEFTIKGICTGLSSGKPEVYFSNEFIENTNVYYEVDNPMPAVRITSGNQLKSIMGYADDNNYELINPYNDDVNSTVDEYQSLKKISAYILIVGLILFVSITIFLNVTLIKNNNRAIGILRRYGCSRSYISKMLLIDGLTLIISTMLVAMISYVVYFILNNKAIINNTIFDSYTLPLNWWISIIFIILVIAIELISLMSNIYLLHKKDNRTLLKEF